MMEDKIIIIIGLSIVILLIIFLPVIVGVIRDYDYKRQLTGKRPMRRVRDKKRGGYYDDIGSTNAKHEVYHDESRLKRMQNLFGPK